MYCSGWGSGALGLGLARPALAQDAADGRPGRLTSSFVPSLDLIYGGADSLRPNVAELTDGKFTIHVSPAGEIAPALETLDAVSNGTADCAHTALSYYWSKDPSFIFASSTPFGMNARQHNAWLSEGGGGDLINELLADRNVFALPGGNTGGQMAGWFRKEIHSGQDFQGLKMRIGGFAGKVFQTLGAEPVDAAEGRHLCRRWNPAALDAFEWVGPYDDEKFGDGKDGDQDSDLQVRALLLLSRLVEGRHADAFHRRRRRSSKRCRSPIRPRSRRRPARRQSLDAGANTTPTIPAR